MTSARFEVLTQTPRRRWSLTDKRRIVAETVARGASVSAVARRYGVHASQLFAWRKAAREGLLSDAPGLVDDDGAPDFVPVVIAAGPTLPAPAPTGAGRIEIVLAGERRVIVDATVDAAALARVLGVLERR